MPGDYLERAGGMRRYVALLLGADDVARLVRECAGRNVLAEVPFARDPALEVIWNRLRDLVDGEVVPTAEDADRSLRGGGVGLVVRE